MSQSSFLPTAQQAAEFSGQRFQREPNHGRSTAFYLKHRAVEFYGAASLALLIVGSLSGVGIPATWIFLPMGFGMLALTYWLKQTPVVRMTQNTLEFRPGLLVERQVLPLVEIVAVREEDERLTLTPRPSAKVAPIVLQLDVLDRGEELRTALMADLGLPLGRASSSEGPSAC